MICLSDPLDCSKGVILFLLQSSPGVHMEKVEFQSYSACIVNTMFASIKDSTYPVLAFHSLYPCFQYQKSTPPKPSSLPKPFPRNAPLPLSTCPPVQLQSQPPVSSAVPPPDPVNLLPIPILFPPLPPLPEPSPGCLRLTNVLLPFLRIPALAPSPALPITVSPALACASRIAD